jgi:hypothetical protein
VFLPGLWPHESKDYQQTAQYTAPADHENHEQRLQIPKEYVYAVTRRRTYNTMATRKRTKRLTIVDKPVHRKVMIEQHESRYNIEINRFCFISGTRRVTLSEKKTITEIFFYDSDKPDWIRRVNISIGIFAIGDDSISQIKVAISKYDRCSR